MQVGTARIHMHRKTLLTIYPVQKSVDRPNCSEIDEETGHT
jgi:hypothetical protein